jgi:hypothetical protein
MARVAAMRCKPLCRESQMAFRDRKLATLIGDPIPESLEVGDLLTFVSSLNPGGSGMLGCPMPSSITVRSTDCFCEPAPPNGTAQLESLVSGCSPDKI